MFKVTKGSFAFEFLLLGERLHHMSQDFEGDSTVVDCKFDVTKFIVGVADALAITSALIKTHSLSFKDHDSSNSSVLS